MSDPRPDDLDDVDIDPDEAIDAEDDAELTRDPGADLDTEGVPADDRTSQFGEVPDPEVPAAPTDEPVGATAHGTTAEEQRTGESHDARLAQEQPDEPAQPAADSIGPAEEAAVHVEDVPPTAPDVPRPPDEAPPDDAPPDDSDY